MYWKKRFRVLRRSMHDAFKTAYFVAKSSGFALRKRDSTWFFDYQIDFRESDTASRVGGNATSGSHRKGVLYVLG